jgi:hypothetical protein
MLWRIRIRQKWLPIGSRQCVNAPARGFGCDSESRLYSCSWISRHSRVPRTQPLWRTRLDAAAARPGRVPAISVVPGCKLSSADGGQVHGDHSADRLRPCLRPSALHRRVDRGDGCSRLVPSRDHAVEAACLQAIVAGHSSRCNESPRPRTALAYRLCSLALLLGCAARNRLSSSGESLDRPIVSVTC